MRQKILFTLSFIYISFFSYAQDNYEIQVYGSQTQPKGSAMFELHSNFTFNGEKAIIDGVRPSNHALHETLEITNGITDNFELGFYLFTNYTSQYGYQIIGSHIRPRIMAPLSWHLPVGLSLSTEFGYQSKYYSPDTWSIEIRPIVDKQWKNLYVSFNPTVGVALKGIDQHKAPDFEPNVKVAYQFFKNTDFGFEYYGSVGPINNFEQLPQENHALFLVYDLENNNDWEVNIGPGWGLTPATDGLVFKVLIGRKIKWGHKMNS
ncbi:hypothetical protein [Hydrotalea sp.]|uniref:hypothetical protein n=1 Tax=Hydrotalea sp. TaxID=2881279 RepID=UPI0025899D91|nr:hypothetical protein [Hydrotalea sp.]